MKEYIIEKLRPFARSFIASDGLTYCTQGNESEVHFVQHNNAPVIGQRKTTRGVVDILWHDDAIAIVRYPWVGQYWVGRNKPAWDLLKKS